MTVVGITMVKDEADIVAQVVQHMLAEVDHVIVADNLSTDGTARILDELAAMNPRLTVIVDDDPAYRQSEKMTRLAALAMTDYDADWVVPFDADEWWWSPLGSVGEVLSAVDKSWTSCAAILHDHVSTDRDLDVSDPIIRLGWRRATPVAMPKVAARTSPNMVVQQGNHDVFYGGRPGPTRGGLLAVHHYPYRSEAQFVRKVRNGAAAYLAAGERVRPDQGAHWRQWGMILDRDGPAALVDIYRKWYHRDDPTVPYTIDGEWQAALVFDPPWQT